MSKIGRKPIAIGNVKIEIIDNEIHFKGKKADGVHLLPLELKAHLDDSQLLLKPNLDQKLARNVNEVWGLHRALVSNKIRGADVEFEKKVNIIGLGYKAVLSGTNIRCSLGYTDDINFEIPIGVSVEVDKTGQNLTFRSSNRELLGLVCSKFRALRKPEPYKGTGIKLETEVIMRKAGKTKA